MPPWSRRKSDERQCLEPGNAHRHHPRRQRDGRGRDNRAGQHDLPARSESPLRASALASHRSESNALSTSRADPVLCSQSMSMKPAAAARSCVRQAVLSGPRTGNLKMLVKTGHKGDRHRNWALSEKMSPCGGWIGDTYLIENMNTSDGHRRTHFRTPGELPKTSLAWDI
jgi:hypothetical protein